MATRRYISRVNVGTHSAHVEIAIYDPNRWKDATPKGGAKFGHEATVYAQPGGSGWDGPLVAGVSVGGLGTHSADDAEGRIDVYQQGADVARFITDMAQQDVAPEVMQAYLNQQLGGGHQTTARFVYRSGDKNKVMGILALVGDAWVAKDVA